jgi:hypothetical protein
LIFNIPKFRPFLGLVHFCAFGIGSPHQELKLGTNPKPTAAEALFKKETRIREGEKSMAAYQAERQAVRDKTARLRALRLAAASGASTKMALEEPANTSND